MLAVDDDPSFLALLRELVRASAHLELAGEAHCGERAIEVAREVQPDVVLMDIRMPGIGGMKAAEAIRAASRSTLIVMVSSMHPDEVPPSAYSTFACTLLWKSTLAPRILDQAWLDHRDELAPPR